MRKIKLSTDIVDDFSHNPPVNLEKLAEALNITVIYSDKLPKNINGALVKNPKGMYEIIISRFPQWYVQRFTLAHEIAHYVFHRGWLGDGIFDDYLFRSHLEEDREKEANNYAIEILMPAELVKEKWHQLASERGGKENVELFEIAEYFDVPPFAMNSRLNELGILSMDSQFLIKN